MNKQSDNFINLLCSFVHQTPPVLTDPDWEEIYRLSQAHNLTPAIYEAAYALPEFSTASQEIANQFMTTALGQSSTQFIRTEALFVIYEKLLAAGVRPLILKGLICRSLYPQPDLRLSCDEDLWIRKEDVLACDNVLRDNGYMAEDQVLLDHLDKVIDTAQELTYESDVLMLEMHLNPFGSNNSTRVQLNQLFAEAFQHVTSVEIEGHTIYTLDATWHYLFIFFHLYKHFISGGVGIRQVLDLLLYYEHYQDKIDFSFIEPLLDTFGAHTFHDALFTLGRERLGFSALPAAGFSGDLDPLLTDLIESGAYGNGSKAMMLSSTYIRARIQQKKTGIPSILTMLFPPVSHASYSYPWLIEKPWLLPVAWILRFFKFFTKTLPENQGLTSQTFERGKTRFALLEQLDLLDPSSHL